MPKRKEWDAAELLRSGSLTACAFAYCKDLAMLNYAAATINDRRKCLITCFDWLAERDITNTVEITRPILERYQRHLFHYRKSNGEPLAVITQSGHIKALKGFFSWAVKKHHVPANPAADLDYARPIKKLPVSLTVEEIQSILAQPDMATPFGVRDRAILEVLYSTGMRRMEICNLKIDDIDYSAAIVRIIQGKGKKDRVIPIGERAAGFLRLYIENVRDLLLADANDRLVFVSKSGAAYVRNTMGDTVRKYLRAAGVTKKGACHLFRHSMATHLLDNGADIRYIQEMLGHASLDTTAKYTQVSIERLKAVHSACHPAERNKHTHAHKEA
ncbi:MAG: site-specific tyrosine recombinase XerC [Planctomycetes bacterium]|nr:site-specific tyrosine recombinase XerC [Planctomycetota bacterium]